MAWIVGDSFDYYSSVADIGRSVWDSASTTVTFAVGRFGTGQCIIRNTGSPFVQKTVGTNEATLFVALAHYQPGALSGTTVNLYVQFRDGASNQCTVCFESGGNITLKSGNEAGTVIATYPAAFAQDVWTHFQIRVVISNTAGSMTVRKNGQTSDTYASATNLNTRAGTPNNYANVVAISPLNGTPRIDDVLLYSASGAAPNDWVGDVRAVCLAPSADTAQKQMAPSPGATGTALIGVNAGAQIMTPNVLRLSGPFLCTRSGLLTNAALSFASGMTGNAQVALYASDGIGGAAGTLLQASSVVTNPVTGTVNFAFPGTLTLVQGRSYYFAYNADAQAGSGVNSMTVAMPQFILARAYSLGFPATAPGGMTASSTCPFATLTLSGNVAVVSEALANGDTDFVFSATVNDADLYDVDDLSFTPQSIVGVVSKVYIKKSDAGARSGQVLMKSGATQVAGTDTVLSSTYTYYSRVDPVDPNTGTTWTVAGINAVQVGQKVTA